MIVETYGERAAAIVYGEWTDDSAAEDAVIVQRDAGNAIVIMQRERHIVVNAAMARELAKVLVREAKTAEIES